MGEGGDLGLQCSKPFVLIVRNQSGEVGFEPHTSLFQPGTGLGVLCLVTCRSRKPVI